MDDILGDLGYGATEPSRDKQFRPWHKPRKQFVRETQWIFQIKKLVEESFGSGDSRLSYLGLPGDDLLDLKAIYKDVCEEKEVELRFLGFNKSLSHGESSIEINISMDEMSKLNFVCPKSEIIADDFKMIGNMSEMAHKKVLDIGTFDVINVDLCDGFAVDLPGSINKNYYDALFALGHIQSKHRRPWLLFLTTRVTPDDVHQSVYDILSDVFGRMLVGCDEFKEEVRGSFGISEGDDLSKSAQSPHGVLHIFLTGLCHWFLKNSSVLNPPVKVELKSVQGYKTYPYAETQELVSIALKFTPQNIGLPDTSGLSFLPGNGESDECAEAVKFVRRIASLVDVDQLLADKSEIRDKMIANTVELLELARFDRNEVEKWIQEGCPC